MPCGLFECPLRMKMQSELGCCSSPASVFCLLASYFSRLCFSIEVHDDWTFSIELSWRVSFRSMHWLQRQCSHGGANSGAGLSCRCASFRKKNFKTASNRLERFRPGSLRLVQCRTGAPRALFSPMRSQPDRSMSLKLGRDCVRLRP